MCAAPQRIAMIASTVNAAAMNPAANCPPPPAGAPDAISATAPIASASVDRPTRVVSRPQRMKRMPTTSTLLNDAIGDRGGDRNANFDAGGVGASRRNPKADARAICDPGRERHADGMVLHQRAGAMTAWARLSPCLAAAAAMKAEMTQRHLDRDDEPVPCLAGRDRNFSPQHVIVFMLA